MTESNVSHYRPGLLLVGHGTRDIEGQAEFGQLAERVAAALPGVTVVACCLELTEPSIAEGVDELVRRQVRSFVVVPVLLFAGGHARTDIPGAVAEAVAAHPGLTYSQATHLGCQTPLIALSVRRFVDARPVFPNETDLGARAGVFAPSPATTSLVFVGRGGSDLDARAEMHHFVAQRLQVTPVGHCVTGFLAGPGPTLQESLDAAMASGASTIVVQPHLLFQGRLVREVRRVVEQRAAARPDLVWRLAEHLGPADEIVNVLLENYAS